MTDCVAKIFPNVSLITSNVLANEHPTLRMSDIIIIWNLKKKEIKVLADIESTDSVSFLETRLQNARYAYQIQYRARFQITLCIFSIASSYDLWNCAPMVCCLADMVFFRRS